MAAINEEEMKGQIFKPNSNRNNYHHFSQMGFTGDIDDLEEDEIEKDIADNDDWMF